jgi:hypothetical protein
MPHKVFIIVTGLLNRHKIPDWLQDKENSVISTWHSQKAEGAELERLGYNLIYDDEPGGVIPFNSTNCQIKAIINGVHFAASKGATHVLRIRSDMILEDCLKFKELLSAEFDHEYKLVVPAGLVVHIPQYYFLDIIFFGRIAVMEKFFSTFQMHGDKRGPECFLAETYVNGAPMTKSTIESIFLFFGNHAAMKSIRIQWFRCGGFKPVDFNTHINWY